MPRWSSFKESTQGGIWVSLTFAMISCVLHPPPPILRKFFQRNELRGDFDFHGDFRGDPKTSSGVLGRDVCQVPCPAGRARCARGGHFVTCDRFAWCSRWSQMKFCADQREGLAKPKTHHEVVAVRTGRFCGLRW